MLRCSLAFLSRARVPQGVSARVCVCVCVYVCVWVGGWVGVCVCVCAHTGAHTHASGTHNGSYTTTSVTEYPRRVSNPHLLGCWGRQIKGIHQTVGWERLGH
jgi:hypothetical protein